MQRKNFLFERSDLDQPTSTVLFKKWEFEKAEFSTSSTNLLSQVLLTNKSFKNRKRGSDLHIIFAVQFISYAW